MEFCFTEWRDYFRRNQSAVKELTVNMISFLKLSAALFVLQFSSFKSAKV